MNKSAQLTEVLDASTVAYNLVETIARSELAKWLKSCNIDSSSTNPAEAQVNLVVALVQEWIFIGPRPLVETMHFSARL